jgi:hypothetical protein
MKKINAKKYRGLDAEGEYYSVSEEKKSIILNGKEYDLSEDVWNFMLCLESEREYFKKQSLKIINHT